MSKKGASCIHLKKVKNNSEAHNERKTKYNMPHVDPTLTPQNESWVVKGVWDTLPELKELVKQKTGRSMQQKCNPFVEGVIVTKSTTTMDNLKKFGFAVKEKYGWEPIQIHMHHDEGHKDENGVWKENYHAHIIFEMINRETGKTYKYDQDDLSDLQTLVAESLGMERGESSNRRHANNIEFKEQQAKITARMQAAKAVDVAHAFEGKAAALLESSIVKSLSDFSSTSTDTKEFTLLRDVAKSIGLKPSQLVVNGLKDELESIDDAKADKLCKKLELNVDGMTDRSDKINAVKTHLMAVADVADDSKRDAKLFRPILNASKILNVHIVPILRNAIQFKVADLKSYPEMTSQAAVERLMPKISCLDNHKLEKLCDSIDADTSNGDKFDAIKASLMCQAREADRLGVSPSYNDAINNAAAAVGTSVEELNKEPRVLRETVNDVLIQAVDKMDAVPVKKICDELKLQTRKDFYPADMKVCVRNAIMESTRSAEEKGVDANSTNVVRCVAEVADVDILSLPKTKVPVYDRESFDKLWNASAMLGNNPQDLMTEYARKGIDQLETVGIEINEAEERRDNAIKEKDQAVEERNEINAVIEQNITTTLDAVGLTRAEVIKKQIHNVLDEFKADKTKIDRKTILKLAELGSEIGLRPSESVARNLEKKMPSFDSHIVSLLCGSYGLPSDANKDALVEKIREQAKDCDDKKIYSTDNVAVGKIGLQFTYLSIAPDFLKKVDELAVTAEKDSSAMERLENIAASFDLHDKEIIKAVLEVGKDTVESGRKELEDALVRLDPSISDKLDDKDFYEVIEIADNAIEKRVAEIGGVTRLEDENKALKRTLATFAIQHIPAIKTLYDAGLKSVNRIVDLMQNMKTMFKGELTYDNVTIKSNDGFLLSRKEGVDSPFVDGMDIKDYCEKAIERENEQQKNKGIKL